MDTSKNQAQAHGDKHIDPLTGEPGFHPVGSGLGAVAGGVVTGAAAGLAGGPIAAGVGAVVGGIAGAYAGHVLAEENDPTVEHDYWRSEYQNRDYYNPDLEYERDFGPAYQYGWESRRKFQDRQWDDVQGDMERDWIAHRASSAMDWNRAKAPAKDAWQRADSRIRQSSNIDAAPPNRPK